jgi:hypothetical protein
LDLKEHLLKNNLNKLQKLLRKNNGKEKKLTPAQKYNQLKRQTESAGMKVKEVDGKIVVTRKKKK